MTGRSEERGVTRGALSAGPCGTSTRVRGGWPPRATRVRAPGLIDKRLAPGFTGGKDHDWVGQASISPALAPLVAAAAVSTAAAATPVAATAAVAAATAATAVAAAAAAAPVAATAPG